MIRAGSQRLRNRRLLSACVFFSLFLHASLLCLFQTKSVWIDTSMPPAEGKKTWEMASRSEILKETFQTMSKSREEKSLSPQKMATSQALKQTFDFLNIEEPGNALQDSKPLPFNPTDLFAQNTAAPIQISSPLASLDLFPSDLELPTLAAPPSTSTPSSALPQKLQEMLTFNEALFDPLPEEPTSQAIAYESSSLETPLLTDETIQKRASLSIPTPPLPSFPTLDDLDTSSYSDSFDLDIVCSPREDKEGYLFALTLIPRQDLRLPKIKQHYSFLIDRANSVQRERLLATKSAVFRALDELDSEDTFNIVIFDSKVEKAFPSNQTVTSASLTKARDFLDQVQLGSFFTPADLFNPLLMTLPYRVEDDEVYTTVLLTDGENFSKKSAMQAVLQTWTLQNRGKASLFTIGMGSDFHLAALDAASAFNKGHLYYSPTKRGLRRKLLRLMKNVHFPVAKNISAKAITTYPEGSIELFPKSHRMPNLYLNQPIVILGSCDKQDDFILFVQGRCKDCWFNIKKTISFINAKKGGHSLRKEWALQQAYECYERYTLDDNPDHLVEAKQLLLPFDIQPAFQ